jgi:hypothetical protein
VSSFVSSFGFAELSCTRSRRRRCAPPRPDAPAPGVRPGGRSRRSAPGNAAISLATTRAHAQISSSAACMDQLTIVPGSRPHGFQAYAMLTRMHDLAAHAEASSLSLGDKLTIILVILAVVTIITSAWAVRRWGNRRRRVLITFESTRLIPDLPLDDRLEVSYRTFPVKDPRLVRVRVQNIGPVDVSSDDFDSRRTIAFRTNCQFYGLVASSHPQYTISSALGVDNGVVEMRPMLLKRNEMWEVSAIVSGEPHIEYGSPPLLTLTSWTSEPSTRNSPEASCLSSFVRPAQLCQ